MSLTAFSISRGFCMSGRKLLDPTTYLVGLHIYYKMIHGPYNISYRVFVVLLLKISPVHATKAYRGSMKYRLQSFVNLGGRMGNLRPGRFTSWKEHRCLTTTRPGGLLDRSARFEKENHLPILGFEPRTAQPVCGVGIVLL